MDDFDPVTILQLCGVVFPFRQNIQIQFHRNPLRINLDLLEISEDRCGFNGLLFPVDKNPHIISFFHQTQKAAESGLEWK